MKYRIDSPFRFVAAQVRRCFAWMFDYHTTVTDAEWGRRLAVCETCEHLEDGQCKVCTCPVEAKCFLALERCPKGKWHRVWKRKSQ